MERVSSQKVGRILLSTDPRPIAFPADAPAAVVSELETEKPRHGHGR